MADDTVFYAIGDIHGEAARLRDLHVHIDEFHEACYPSLVKHLVYLGDYVDRGPNSQGVIEQLMARQHAHPETTTCLMGNHEEMMLDAVDGKSIDFWLRNGGAETLASYKVEHAKKLPPSHMNWVRSLQTTYTPDGTDFIFVHAGVDPILYPHDDEVKRRWMRGSRFFDTTKWVSPALRNKRVIHGHTPTATNQADISDDGRRINVDTGATYGGALTAAVLKGAETPVFLQA